MTTTVDLGQRCSVTIGHVASWQTLSLTVGDHVTTVIIKNRQHAWELACGLAPGIGDAFDRARTATNALFELSYPKCRSQELREIADHLDCDGGCEGCGPDADHRGDFCKFVAANNLRALAKALDLKHEVDTHARDRSRRWRRAAFAVLNPIAPRLAIRLCAPDRNPVLNNLHGGVWK